MTIITDDNFVRLYQRRAGLKEDGVAGPVTVGKLGGMPAARLPLSDDAFVRLFQGVHGLVVDGWAGRATIAKLDALHPPAPSSSDGLPDDYWPMLAKIESSNDPNAKATTSSASGLYQFIKATWIGEGGKWGPVSSLPFGGMKPSVEEQTARAKTFTAKNAAYLRSRGVAINKATLYAAHFLGALTAAKLLAADFGESAEALAGPAATRANRSILDDKTVQDFVEWLHKKTGDWAK